MTKFDCGCRILSDIINLNSGDYKKKLTGDIYLKPS